MDYVQYQPSLKLLTITRNPFGFINVLNDSVYDGVTLNDQGNLSDAQFIKLLEKILKTRSITINARLTKIKYHQALPDTLDTFSTWFLDKKKGILKNENIFKKRILGLTSYFRSAQEQLMPAFNKETDLHIVEIPMSNYQLAVYETARKAERKLEKQQARKKKKQGSGVYEDSVSTYRIFFSCIL